MRPAAVALLRRQASKRAQRQRGVVRARFGRGGYEGARTDLRELVGWTPSLTSADQASLSDIPALRARTYDLERNAPIASGAIITRLDNVVGSGLVPTPQLDREFLGLSEAAAEQWQRTARLIVRTVTCTPRFDVAGRLNFARMQRLALRSALSGGDAFAVRRWKAGPGDLLALKVQLLEADRCANPPGESNGPRLRDGVALDEFGAATGFWISNQHPNEFEYGAAGLARYDFLPAYGAHTGAPMVLHILDQQRLGQTRGVPYLAPVIVLLRQIARYADSELAAAVLASFFTVFVKHSSKTDAGPGLSDLTDPETESLDVGEDLKLGQGAVIDLEDDAAIDIANPARPNAQFGPFVDAIAAYIGVALGIPKELLLKQFNASYSASRAALQEAWRAFEAQQDWLVDTFCQPVYEWIIAEAVQRGLLDAPGFFEDVLVRQAYVAATWAGPIVTSLDPLKEVNAAIRRIDGGLSSRQIEAPKLTGYTWEEIHAQQVAERNKRVRDGLQTDEIITSGLGSMILADDKPTPPNNGGGNDSGEGEGEGEEKDDDA